MSSSFTTAQGPPSSSPYGQPPSPEVPPYSPISPVAPEFPSLNQIPKIPKVPQPDYMEKPPAPEAINESTNPDAIALRAAISVLQVQRQRALQDLQTLEQQRETASANAEEFAKALAEGKVRSATPQGILGTWQDPSDSDDSDADTPDDAAKKKRANAKAAPKAPTFGQIPAPQNIVRCPPINWAKYHVAGDALDKLHLEQQLRPDPGLPSRDPAGRAPEHHIAAPYSPWKDKLSATTTPSRGHKKG